MGSKSRSRELALHCSDHPNRHWMSGRSDQSSVGWEEGEAGVPSSGSFGSWGPLSPSLVQLVWTVPSLERQGLGVTASQKSKDYRFASGRSLLSHRCPRTLLSLGSEHCIRTPLGGPRQKLTAVRLAAPRVTSPHPLCLYLRAALLPHTAGRRAMGTAGTHGV